jgi:hypothetical protein
MKYERTAAGYAEYIQSEHWSLLREAVFRRDGHRCVECGSTERLSAHHKVYAPDWEKQSTADLETLCWPCHEKRHPEKHPAVTVTVRVEVVPVAEKERCYTAMWELISDRSKGLISRSEFKRWKSKLKGEELLAWKEQSRFSRKKRRKSGKSKKPKKIRRRNPCVAWHYNPTHRKKWVNRGSSSN